MRYQNHGRVTSIVFNKSGSHMITGSMDKTIKLWTTDSEQAVTILTGHTSWISSVALSPDDSKVLSASDDGTMILWNTATGRQIARFLSFPDGEWVVYTPDGYYNSSAGGDKYITVRRGNDFNSLDYFRSSYYRQDMSAVLKGQAR
jgi:WD40 repeat protein